MTNKELMAEINKTAIAARKSGQTIEIDFSLPYVDINGTGSVYFFQGQDAADLLENAITLANKLNACSPEDIILWQSQGW